MSLFAVKVILAAAVATGGTFTVAYPAGTTAGSFKGGKNHYIVANQAKFVAPTSCTFTFNAASITVTYNGTTSLAAGTEIYVNLDEGGEDPGATTIDALNANATVQIHPVQVVTVTLGSPIANDADGACASQSVNSGVAALLNGALVSGGRCIFDVPRNVVAAWTNTAVCTVTGKDVYGNTVVEASASGTSLTGKKAFKEVTSVTFNANVTGATVGTGNVLGLPIYLPGTTTSAVLKELEDEATATAGTCVGGLAVGTKSTATTADVRGTYTPNSTPDGAKGFKLILALEDPTFIGNPQFAG